MSRLGKCLRGQNPVRRAVAVATGLVGTVLLATPALAQSNGPGYGLMVEGTQIDWGDDLSIDRSGPFGPEAYPLSDFCAASPLVGDAMRQLIGQMDASMREAESPVTFTDIEMMPGAPTRDSIANNLRVARDAVCNQPDPARTVQTFVVTYSSCRMTMSTATELMEIHLPSDGSDARMSMADHTTREVTTMSLTRSAQALQDSITAGWGDTINMTATGRSDRRLGRRVSEYDFEFAGGVGVAGMGQAVQVQNTGTAWIASDVPGMDAMRAFYENMTRAISPEEASSSMLGALITNLVGMLREGMPLDMEQQTTSTIMGRSSMSSRSRNLVTNTSRVDLNRSWCDDTIMPPGYTVMDVDQQLSQALAGGGNEEMAAAMQEYQDALDSMSPEDRRRLEEMGLGDMLGSMTAGGGMPPGGMPSGMTGGMPTAAAAPQAATAAESAVASASMSAAGGRSSSQLMGATIEESVSNHLDELGYDLGSGSSSVLYTEIAIAQYQAERGMEVTGVATPQLLGAMAAEVDGR